MQNLRKGVLIVGFCLFLFALATDNAYLMEGVVGMWAFGSIWWLTNMYDTKYRIEYSLRCSEAEVERLEKELEEKERWEARYEKTIESLKERVHDLEVEEGLWEDEARQDQEEIEELKETIAKLKKNQ